MAQVSGQVYKIFENTIQNGRDAGKTRYQIKLEGDPTYYGTYITRPSCNAGDNVTFDAVTKGNFTNCDLKTLHVTGGAPPQQQQAAQDTQRQAAPAQASPRAMNRDDYWKEKDRYDKEVKQHLICFQSATRDAVTLACAALDKDIIPLGQKKAGKMDAFKALVFKLRDELYLEDVKAIELLEAGKPIISPEAVALADKAEEAAANPADDEWANS